MLINTVELTLELNAAYFQAAKANGVSRAVLRQELKRHIQDEVREQMKGGRLLDVVCGDTAQADQRCELTVRYRKSET